MNCKGVLTALCLAAGLTLGASPKGQWVPLFDGKTLNGWQTLRGEPATVTCWTVSDGVLWLNPKAGKRRGDIYTVKQYDDFILEFEWKIPPHGNSGVKYRMTWYGRSYLGPEYQIIADSKRDRSTLAHAKGATAALYDLIAPDPASWFPKPEGRWNKGKIVARGSLIEHWLNGKLVVRVDLHSERFKKAHAASKFRKLPNFAQNPKGRIMLQDHGSKVCYRNIRIMELKAQASKPGEGTRFRKTSSAAAEQASPERACCR